LTPFVTEWQPANNSTDMHLLSNPYREINMQMISTKILGTAPEAATSVESCGTKADIAAQDGVASAMEPTQLRKVAPLKKEAVRVARLAVSKGFQTVALRAGLRFHCCPCRRRIVAPRDLRLFFFRHGRLLDAKGLFFHEDVDFRNPLPLADGDGNSVAELAVGYVRRLCLL